MSTKSKRLDLLLEELGYFSSRQVARTAIMDGGVLVNGVKITKPGTPIKDGAKIQLTNAWQPQKYVSRGGLKLEKAVLEFKLDVKNKECLDIGASTGGFTDCLLKSGAKFVYAIDVGHGQLDWSLRSDPRVKVIERCNARNLSPESAGLSEAKSFPELAVIDVSFISLLKVLPAVKTCLSQESFMVIALIKPQFEAGPEHVGKNGVVRSSDVHKQVIRTIVLYAARIGLFASKLTFSPLKGPKGNIEFLVLFSNKPEPVLLDEEIADTVEQSAKVLNQMEQSSDDSPPN